MAKHTLRNMAEELKGLRGIGHKGPLADTVNIAGTMYRVTIDEEANYDEDVGLSLAERALTPPRRTLPTMYEVTNIKWVTDGEDDLDLPKKIVLGLMLEGGEDSDAIEERLGNKLSDIYGWLHDGFDVRLAPKGSEGTIEPPTLEDDGD